MSLNACSIYFSADAPGLETKYDHLLNQNKWENLNCHFLKSVSPFYS